MGEGVEGKEGEPAKPAEKMITVSALGNAISFAVAVATQVERDGVGKIAKVETFYPPMKNGNIERGVAQIRIQLDKERLQRAYERPGRSGTFLAQRRGPRESSSSGPRIM